MAGAARGTGVLRSASGHGPGSLCTDRCGQVRPGHPLHSTYTPATQLPEAPGLSNYLFVCVPVPGYVGCVVCAYLSTQQVGGFVTRGRRCKKQTASHHPHPSMECVPPPLASLDRSQQLPNRVRRSSCALGTTAFPWSGAKARPQSLSCETGHQCGCHSTRMTLQSGAKSRPRP